MLANYLFVGWLDAWETGRCKTRMKVHMGNVNSCCYSGTTAYSHQAQNTYSSEVHRSGRHPTFKEVIFLD